MDFYQVLGVKRSATAEEIGSAYRKIAIKTHPDHNPNDPASVAIFKKATEAYETLSDAHRKARYDGGGFRTSHKTTHSTSARRQTTWYWDAGEEPQQPRPKEKKPEPPPPPPPKKPEVKVGVGSRVGNEHAAKAIEATCSYFGNSKTGQSILAQIELDPEDFVKGGEKYVKFRRRRSCNRCSGTGATLGVCPSCEGGYQMKWCDTCDVSGLADMECVICKGEGLVDSAEIKVLLIRFPPNITNGFSIMVAGEGEQPFNKPPGHCRVVLMEKVQAK